MSQVKLSKAQLAILDAIIADAEEKGKTSLGETSDCFIDCVVSIVTATTPVVAATVGAVPTGPVSLAKLIEYRKKQ
jgi:hypothetical protein